MTYRNKTRIFSADPARGAEYFGQCALISVWWPHHCPGCQQAEVFTRARVAARYAIRALKSTDKGKKSAGLMG